MQIPPEDWIVPEWPVPACVHALITTRNGGSSTGPYASMNLSPNVGDEPAAVAANRRRLRQCLPAEPKWLNQVHGTRVVDARSLTGPAEADAATAHGAGFVCVVMVADCLPILFADRAGTRVAVAHAGWRGLAAGVIENTVRALDTPGQDLVAYLGPAIGPAAFEVGADVRDAFTGSDPHARAAFEAYRAGKWKADLFALARARLARLGVTHVFGKDECTYSAPRRFFSHRRDQTSGRMAALVWIGD